MPIQTTIKVDYEKLKRGLSKFKGALDKIPDRDMKKMVEAAKGEVAKYPAKLPNQTYQRTGDYGRSWKIVKNKVRSYTLKSTGVSYARYVGGLNDGTGQAYMHKHGYKGRKRWNTLYSAMSNLADKIVKQIAKAVNQAIKESGLGK